MRLPCGFILVALAAAAGAQSTGTPLQTPAPALSMHAGPLGKLSAGGFFTAFAYAGSNPFAGDAPRHADFSNAMLYLQKPVGTWQFYVQAGAYNFPALGAPFMSTARAQNEFFGAVPIAYGKYAPNPHISVEAGLLPTMLGVEDAFSYQNATIEDGLVWGQEPFFSRGVQVNVSGGKWSGAISWNDGYFSDRYTWMDGEVTYAVSPSNSIEFEAGGNLGHTAWRTPAVPVQNNSRLYVFAYNYTRGPWNVAPYFQYTDVPASRPAAVAAGAATRGFALPLSYRWKSGIFLGGRAEYISSTGSAAQNSVNLLYGPGSAAWAVTLTPGYQRQIWFVRGEWSSVRALHWTTGSAFGPNGSSASQVRAAIETGVIF